MWTRLGCHQVQGAEIPCGLGQEYSEKIFHERGEKRERREEKGEKGKERRERREEKDSICSMQETVW